MAVGAVGCGKIGRLNLVNYATADVDSTMPPSCYITINDKNIVDTHNYENVEELAALTPLAGTKRALFRR